MQLIKIFVLLFTCFIFSGFSYEYNPEKVDATNNAQMRNNLGTMYAKIGQYNKAINEYKIAIMLNPNSTASASYYNNLGLLYLKFNKYALAQDCFEHSIKINPAFYEYYKNLIITYDKSGSLDGKLLNEISKINHNPNNSKAYLMAGLMCYQKNNKICAKEYLSKFMQLEPDYCINGAIKKIIKK